MNDAVPYHEVGFGSYLLERKGINRLRISEGERLLGEGARLIDETGRTSLDGARMLMVAQATRATHSYEVVVGAARMGRGVQASMLNRSLLEDALDIHWVAANPKIAPERAGEHDRLMALSEHELETKFERTGRPLNDEERSELDALIELYGGRERAYRASWTRAGFKERFALVQEAWNDEPEAEGFLDYIYEAIQRRNNLLLHPSPSAYRQTITVGPGDRRMLNRAGPDPLWREALMHGAGGYYLCSRALALEFGFDKEPMAAVFSRVTCLCRSIDSLGDLDELSADAECPCGSGWPVAECHRS
jgi:hypothetical protein